KQCAVSAQRHEAVEAGCALEGRRGRRRPEGGNAVLGEEGEAEARRRLREVREQVLEVAVARVADDPDVHEGASDSSEASARTRAAIPGPVSPTSASCWARGACSYVRSGPTSGQTSTSGALACSRAESVAPTPFTSVH